MRAPPSDRDGGAEALVLGSLPDPLLTLDPNGMLSFANPAASALARSIGVPLERGRSVLDFLGKVHIANAGDGAAPWPPVCAEISDEQLTAFALQFPNSPIFRMHSARLDGEGGEWRWLVQLSDVTKLASASSAWAEAARHRDGLVDLMSHDMRSPLVAVITILAHPELKTMAPPLRLAIERGAKQALNMIDSVVRLVRVQSRNYVLEPVDVCPLIEEAIDDAWQASTDLGVPVRLEPPLCDFTVMAERGLLIQAIGGLINHVLAHSLSGHDVRCSVDSVTTGNPPIIELTISGDIKESLLEDFDQSMRLLEEEGGTLFAPNDVDRLMLAATIVSRHGGHTTWEIGAGTRREIVARLPIANE